METIKLDLIPGKKMPSLHASQYDDGREHGIDLFENGVAYKLDGTETLTINERKGDDCICSLDIENTFADSNHIVFASTEQMCAVWGNNICELVIAKGEKTIGTLNFILEVEPSPTEGGIESESEIKNLERQIEEITEEVIGEDYYTKTQTNEAIATAIEGKADKTYVDEELNKKANKSNTYTKSQTDRLLEVKVDESEIKPLINDNAQTTSLLGSNSLTTETTTLNANEIIELGDAPRFIKKNVGVTARVKFNSFTSVTVGKGYQTYRGKWVVIDATHITAHFFENSDLVQTPIAHGLTISDYLQISLFVDADGVCRISINTTSGTFTTSIDFGYEWNYEPFLFGGQIMTDAKLNYSCDDLKCPLWVFGDSYMGFNLTRVAGQLKELHFINYCINAIAGARSVDTTTPNKSSFEDLQKMLEVATPKFIIWADGMNGGDALNIEFLPTLIALCEEKGIELILYMPPSIPTISHTDLNNYIVSTGKRYVNGNDAVGATSEGVWYEGYLSNDNTHPTELGAKALALRFLNDAPELLQYGWNYDVKSDLATKLDKANPVGTGAISFNRRAGATIGNNAVAVGFNNTSSGDASFAEGGQNKATGAYSHAENYGNEASGGQSHAEGRYTVASGLRSHAEGDSTTANGSFSHSQNRGTIANRMSQTVFGEYNIAETGGTGTRGNFVEIVGNGTNDNNRSNARTLDWQGNEWLAGDLTFNGNKSLEGELSNRYTQTEVDNIVSDAIYNILPTELTPTSPIANFSTTLEMPIKSLEVDVNAVQEAGTPTPSTPLPISGWNAITLDANGNTEVINLGGTYYGGHLTQDKDGKRQFEVTHNIVDLGNLVWTYYTLSPNYWFSNDLKDIIKKTTVNTQIADITCECLKKTSSYNIASGSTTIGIAIHTSGAIRLVYPDMPITVEDLIADISGNKFAYPIAEPYTIDLPDGEPIITLNGTNNIYADTGDCSVEFKVSVEQYVSNHSGGGLGGGLLGGGLGGAKSGGSEEEPDNTEDTEKTKEIDDPKEEIKTIGEKKIGGE